MPEKTPAGDAERQRVAEAALAEVEPGMKLGLGSGRTAEHFVRKLGARVRAGLKVVGVPTSQQTARLALAEGVPLTTLEADPVLDLAVEGALLREKIVAAAARRMIVVADRGKLVKTLGAFPLPIEVVAFGIGATRRQIDKVAARLGLSGAIALRPAGARPFVTDCGNHILDASFGLIPEPDRLAAALKEIVGVVEHGLFIRLATSAIIADGDGVERLSP
jgi:ribose 5-phosphate isomerase A